MKAEHTCYFQGMKRNNLYEFFNCMPDFLNQDVEIQFLSSFIIMMIGKDNLNNCKAVTPLKNNTAGWKSSIFSIGDTDTSSFMVVFPL